MACGEGNSSKPSSTITMSLLLSLPLESTVSPLLPLQKVIVYDQDDVDQEDGEEGEEGEETINASDKEKVMFRSFSFEDYAWRVYRERLVISSPKDPLDRYRITTNS